MCIACPAKSALQESEFALQDFEFEAYMPTVQGMYK